MIDIEAIEAIKARCEAATPGPWRVVQGGPRWEVIAGTEASGHHGVATTHRVNRADADFIATAHEDVPALVAEVARLRHTLGSLQQALEQIRDGRWDSDTDSADIVRGMRSIAGLALAQV